MAAVTGFTYNGTAATGVYIGADQIWPGTLSGLGGWADITAVTGSPTITNYTDTNSVDWKVWTFTGDGSFTCTDGLLDVLIVSGGGGLLDPAAASGNGGSVIAGTHPFTAATHTVTVGAGGTHSATQYLTSSQPSICGPYTAIPVTAGGIGAGWSTGTPGAGLVSSITGTATTYAMANGLATVPNSGNGGSSPMPTGDTGVVILRRPA